MANQETQKLDSIIASRRAMLLGGGAALAALAMPKPANAALTVASYTDADILNFALNLEYLEANFYYLAAFGTTIDVANAASNAVLAPVVPITGTVGTMGVVTKNTTATNGPVPFVNATVKSYAIETAIEEAKHVAFLRTALSTAAVAQPALNLAGGTGEAATAAFNAVATAAGYNGGVLNPYSSDLNFLLGAYIFEDVGVTAYKGAAPLITTTATGKTYLGAAASILAVEAYHAGLIRTTINALDPADAQGYITATQKISATRAALSKAALPSVATVSATNYGDDVPLTLNQMFVLGAPTTTAVPNTPVAGTTIVDGDLTNSAVATITPSVTANGAGNVIAYSRNTTQVLNIVTGGGAVMNVGTKSTGAFFPAGMNGIFA